jgi:hypothetical protein
MSFDAARIPENLKEAYRQKRCALLVGAGASVGAGLPNWGGLLVKMIAEAEAHGVISAERISEYRALVVDPSKFLMIASALKDDLGPYFDGFIRSTFVAPKPQPTSLHKAMVRAENLQFVLTTNYDGIIEKAYRAGGKDDVTVCDFTDTGEVQRGLSKREFFILKAHGDATKIGNGIILTEADYRNILYRQRAYQSLLSAMFTMFTIVFVGASMTDPEIKLLLNYIADSFSPSSGPTHYALMADEGLTKVEQSRWFKDLNVQLIPINKADNYAELPDFMDALHAS